MSTVTEQKRLQLEAKAIAELKERIGRDAYMGVRQVGERLNMGRDKVLEIPREVLPYTDFGKDDRSYRRYHPADVLAVDARVRGWKAAKERGEGEEYLQELRLMLELRDAAALQVADEMARAVA